MTEMLIRRLHLDGFLTFAPRSEPFGLRPLNVLIGANGAGKSNVIEALGLLAAASRDLGQAIRDRGEWIEWLWKGRPSAVAARIEVELDGSDTPSRSEPRCRLVVEPGFARLDLVGEAAAEAGFDSAKEHTYWYYQLDHGCPVSFGKTTDTQRYREVSWAGEALSSIRILDGCALAGQTLRRDTRSVPPVQEGECSPMARVSWRCVLHPAAVSRAVIPGSTHLALRRFLQLVYRALLDRADVNGQHAARHASKRVLEAPIPVSRMSGGTLRFLTTAEPPGCLLRKRHYCVSKNPSADSTRNCVTALLGEVLVDASRRMQLMVTTQYRLTHFGVRHRARREL